MNRDDVRFQGTCRKKIKKRCTCVRGRIGDCLVVIGHSKSLSKRQAFSDSSNMAQ